MAEPFDPIAYLAGKGKHGRQANGPEVAYPCFFDCGESDDSRKRKLYVNTDEGWFDCKVCGASGGSTLLMRHFGDEPVKTERGPATDTHTKRKILNWATDLGMVMLSNNDDIALALMRDRGLSPETLLERKVGWVGGSWSLTRSLPEQFSAAELATTGLVYRDGVKAGRDFLTEHLLIPYLSRGNTVQIRGRAMDPHAKAKYLTGPGEPVRLYGVDALEGADDVLVTEGEFDAMVVAQHLATSPEDKVRKIAVVGLAGANGFKEGFETYFAKAKRIYLALDPDDTGKREAVKIKERLGARAKIVELPADLPKCDWTEYLLPIPADATETWKGQHPHAGHTWRDITALLGKVAGKRVFSMSDSGTAWRRQRAHRSGMKTGYKQLDDAIRPGCLPGQLMIILAKTGTGKTLLLCNMAYTMRQHRWLFFSLEMTREEVYERMQRIYRFWSPLADDDEVERQLANVWICDENRLSDKDFVDILEEYRAEVGASPEVVAVDYLGYFARGQKGNSQYEKVTNACMQLKAMAKADNPEERFFLISPAQVNRMAKDGKPISLDDARDSGAIEETADFLLALYKPDDALEREETQAEHTGKMRLTVLKSRHGNKGNTFNLVMDNLTLAIVDEHTPAARRADENNHRAWRGQTYEAMRAHELRPMQLPLRKDFL